jgi:hypothetical protein
MVTQGYHIWPCGLPTNSFNNQNIQSNESYLIVKQKVKGITIRIHSKNIGYIITY